MTQEMLNDNLLRDNARLKVLANVSHDFAMVGTDYQKLLDKIVRITADLVGDACMITLVEPNSDIMLNAASAHRDANLEQDYKSYLAQMRISTKTSNTVSAQVMRSGLAKMGDVDPATMVAQTDEALKPIVTKLNVHSYVVLPIWARGTIIGTLSLTRNSPNRSYTADDATLLQDLSDRAGLAIENARLCSNLEKRVQQRTHELEAVNKELETFSYSVAHDLRAPLRSIDGFSQSLVEDHRAQLNEDAQECLTRIRDASKRMGQLIEGLLSLSQVTRSKMLVEKVNISRIAQKSFDRLKNSQPERDVEFVAQANLEVAADPRLMDIVLTNLIGNSWKFTEKRKPAKIEFGTQPGDARTPIIYFVRDNGAGFDADYVHKLFGPFQRLHSTKEFEGTGIGLATVQRIINRHNGRIWAEGATDQGATFYFTLGELEIT